MSFASACSRSTPPVHERLAILTFDNQTGDPSLDWIRTAAPKIVANQLVGASPVPVLPVDTVRDAYAARATRLVHGYFEARQGVLHFHVSVEDANSHKAVDTTETNGDALDAAGALAKHLQPSARPFSSSNREAIAAWGKNDFEQATTLDPDFSAAWRDWAESLARQDPEGAKQVAFRAMQRSGLRSAVDKAQIQVLLAGLRNDSAARAEALTALSQLLPEDSATLVALAEAQMNARHFGDAARYYGQASHADPDDSSLPNLLGYAQAFSGKMDDAKKTFEAYGKLPGQAVNSLDSLGEGYFVNGQFGEAEKAFLQANAKDPAFLGGATLWKAAYARYLAGDVKAADGLMQRYMTAQGRARDPLLLWRSASWFYSTGRQTQALALLSRVPTGSDKATDQIIQKQLGVWRNPDSAGDLESLRQLYERTPPTSDGLIRTYYAKALLRAGRKDEARQLAHLWPLPETAGDPTLQSLLYPEFLKLRQAVGEGPEIF